MMTEQLAGSLDDLSPPPVKVDTAKQFVTFTCAGRGFGIDIMAVREIRSWSPAMPLPDQPAGAVGVLDIRGDVVEVYDLASMLGETGADDRSTQVVLVVSLGNRDVGMVVDSVSDIIFANDENLRRAPAAGDAGHLAKVSGLVKNDDHLIAILDQDALFPARPD